MRILTLDPISMNDVLDFENAPFVIEGNGENTVKVYFESEDNKIEYLDIPLHTANSMLKIDCAQFTDSDTIGTIN